MADGEGFVALQAQQHQLKRREENQNDNSRGGGGEEEDDELEEEEEEEGERGIGELQRLDESRLVELPSGQAEELEGPPLETIEAAPLSSEENDQCNGLLRNSSSGTQLEAAFFQGQVVVPGQKVSTSVTAHGAQIQMKNQLHAYVCQSSFSELSPTSVTQSISSAPSPTLPEHKLLKADNACMLGGDQQTCADPNTLTIVTPLKTHIPDGYNWRKYGQKQVKSPKGSRSYYKCTYSNCCAKKIEFSDHSGHVVEIVNKGIHGHDPPRKNNFGREGRNVSSAGPCLGKNVSETSIKMLKNLDPATLSKEPPLETPVIPDKKRNSLIASDGNKKIDIKEEHISEPEPKQRAKKRSLAACAETAMKSGKKPKIVVRTVGDVGISSDGYRWRKYGQKMVKGNPHPRNYYRCTSAGCPARKHIETAVDNTSNIIITYKGVHDHDMPVPKKRHGPPSAPLVAAAASGSMSHLQLKKTDASQNWVTPTQWSVSKEVELTGQTLDVRGDKEKAIESARTLLSIGFEIKPC